MIAACFAPGPPSGSVKWINAGAVGHNWVSVIVPCHRVIGSDGSLTGYAGGIERKIILINIEQPDFIRTIREF